MEPQNTKSCSTSKMPCESITESVSVTIDHNDRVVDYTLSKVTCGGAVAGRGLIRDAVKYQKAEDTLRIPVSELASRYPDEDPLRQFLRQKHLIAIQALLSAYLGVSNDYYRDHCRITEVFADESGATVVGRIDIDAITEEIKSCGNCSRD